MKTIYSIFAFIVYISFASSAQDYYAPLGRSKTEAVVTDNTYSNLRMHFSLNGIYGKDIVSTEGEVFTELYFGNGYSVGELGSPKLPAFKKLVQIPHGAQVNLKVLGYHEEELNLETIGVKHQLYPVQPSLRKDKEASEEPFHFNKSVYQQKGFSDSPIATVEILGTLRGMRIARVSVVPVKYDPTNGLLKIYNDIEVEITFAGANKSLDENIRSKSYSPYFEPIYSVIDNSYTKSVYDDHPDLVKYPVKMLIVSHRMFETTLEPFVAWKTKKGFYVEVAYTDDIGETSSAIQNFVHAKYNAATADNPAPTFLVLVGDVAQVPASATGSSSGKKTDLYYASVDGDYFPEMYYGRLSATTTTQLENIINKILYYEQYQFDDPTYLNNATLIAGSDGTWNPRVGQPTVKYGTANYFNADNGFNTVWGYGVSTDPNNPNNSSGYTGSYDNERISVSLINYTAHCAETIWDSPRLNISNVNSMTNTNKYPLAIGNCCLSGDFGYSESIGEAWIRAENKGAVTYIGSSPNSFWFEDFYWSVGAFPISGNNEGGYVPTFEETTFGAYDAPFHSNYVTTGGIVFIGNLAVTEVDIQNYPSHSSPLYYWEAYNILGDPSLIPFLTEAEENVVSHMDIAPIGGDFYQVTALPKSYVAISKDGVLHGAAFVDESGEVIVNIEPILDGGNVDIVVTRPQTVPYAAQVPAAALEGPFVVLDSYLVNDEQGNGNSMPDYGEEFSIDVTLVNVGSDIAQSISTTIVGIDDYFSVLSHEPISFGDVESNNTSTVNKAFSLELSNVVPDQYKAYFTLQITDGENNWNSTLSLTANAPVLEIGEITIDDSGEGIPGILDAGETANAVIEITNTGHAVSPIVIANLTTASEYITINGDAIITTESILAGESLQVSFSITADVDTPIEEVVTFNLLLQADQYEYEKDLEVIVGHIPEYVMDNNSVTACIGRFYDSGGIAANYSNSESFTKTFYPSPGSNTLMFSFSSFATEAGYDYLYVYDGENTSAAQFPGSPFSGTNSPNIIISNNDLGAITFRFTSDGSLTALGWEASFTCVDLDVPPGCASNPNPTNGAIVNSNPYTLTWNTVAGALEYIVYFGEGSLPSEPITVTANNRLSVEVKSNSSYSWKVVPKNNAGEAEGCPTWTFTTEEVSTTIFMHTGSLVACNAHFYDSGGPDANYSNNENHTLTVHPSAPKAKVRVTFSNFELESSWDFLRIYDGVDATSNLLATLNGASIPNSYVATNETGALTFIFTSDNSTTRLGWAAVLSCDGVYNVTFAIKNNQGLPVSEAQVEFVDYAIKTSGADGMVNFNEVQANNDLSYTITHNDFHTHEGTVDVINQDVNLDVVMIALSGEMNISDNLKAYPNPFNDYIKVTGVEGFKTIEFTNIIGKSLIKLDISDQEIVIPTSSINKGIYLITITKNNGERIVKRVIKQ